MEIPTNEVTMDEIVLWNKMQEDLAKLKLAESILRKRIVAFHFPEWKEGTNKFPLNAGYVLNAVMGYDRKVNEGLWTITKEELIKAGVTRPDDLVKWEPSLIKSNYNQLTKEQIHIMDQGLIIKESSPQLKIVLPAKNKPKET